MVMYFKWNQGLLKGNKVYVEKEIPKKIVKFLINIIIIITYRIIINIKSLIIIKKFKIFIIKIKKITIIGKIF